MTLNLHQTTALVCNCGASMTIDGAKLAKACGSAEPCRPASALCRGETQIVASAMQQAKDQKKSLLIACTQEIAVFDAIAEETGCPAPATVNIRELAGWSDEGNQATAKIAALIRSATDRTPPTRSLALNSSGRCLIYADGSRANGGVEAALRLGARLNGVLGVTVMIAHADDSLSATDDCGIVTTGKIRSASGHFTKFELVIDRFATALPHSRDTVMFERPKDGVETVCDVLIDLTGDTPLFTGWEKRDGYMRAAGDDVAAIAVIEAEAAQMIGAFEKPIYVNFDESLCAHARNKIGGCSRCLDVCPAGAIQSLGDHVAIDPAICGGCGLCGAVCPSGAAQTAYPPIDRQFATMQRLLDYYVEAGGKAPRLLIHDDGYGRQMIEMLARHGRGLPANLLPLPVHAVGRSGHDVMVGAIALGFEQVFVLLNPAKSGENAPLAHEAALARAMLGGVGADAEHRIMLIDETDPDLVGDHFYQNRVKSKSKPAPFSPIGAPRSITRLAMRGLAKANRISDPVIALPDSAPYGRVDIDTERCTICLSCVSACPAGALQDNPDAPQLLFREDACLQCGICVATCPEKVIALKPQFNLGDDAMAAELVVEDTPFHCTSCGKPFGSTRSIERVIERLASHSMFQSGPRTDILKMCEDCRVEAMFDRNDRMLDVGDRPKPRTTDDYLN
jgi:ferredoxin